MSELRFLGDAPAGSPEWRAYRTSGLGGSEVAAALGLSPWCSPFTLWHRKRGNVPDALETPSMYWGKLLEPAILLEWERRHSPHWPEAELDVRCGGTWVRDGWRIGSPDARVAHDEVSDPFCVVEVKTADDNDTWQWGPSGSDDPGAVPIYYRVQTLWYGDVLDLRDLHLAVLLGGNDYREYVVPWDDTEVQLIREGARAFWQTVLDGQEPDLDSTGSTYLTVRQLHPEIDTDEEVEVPADVFVAWEEAQRAAKAAAEDAAFARSTIAKAMGSARYGTVGDQRVVRRQAIKGGTPYPVLITQREVRQ